MSQRKKIVVICPGRGTYTKETMGRLRNLRGEAKLFVESIDEWRVKEGWPSLTELDLAERFQPAVHTKGENAAAMIYAHAGLDFIDLKNSDCEIVGVLGNSMGWYLALAFSEVLSPEISYQVIQSMGSMLKEGIVGGQVIHTLVNDQWQIDPVKQQAIEDVLVQARAAGHFASVSIELGGYWVLAADQQGIGFLLNHLPKDGDFPFQLINHGAFHSELMRESSEGGLRLFSVNDFHRPKWDLIDGRGRHLGTSSTSPEELYDYTFRSQVLETFSFTRSIVTALKELAPDHLVLLGPGGTLGGAIGQILIQEKWRGMDSKEAFSRRQKENPFLISLCVPEQRAFLLSEGDHH